MSDRWVNVVVNIMVPFDTEEEAEAYIQSVAFGDTADALIEAFGEKSATLGAHTEWAWMDVSDAISLGTRWDK